MPDDNPRTPYEILDTSEKLLLSGWVPGRLAETKDGEYCAPWDERAARWCIVGSIEAVTHYEPNSQAMETFCRSLVDSSMKVILKEGIEILNDTTAQEDAIAVVRAAKEKAAALGYDKRIPIFKNQRVPINYPSDYARSQKQEKFNYANEA